MKKEECNNTCRAMRSEENNGNLESPNRPFEDPEFARFAEVNEKMGIKGDELMSAAVNGAESNLEGWNGVDDIDQSEYGKLIDAK